MITQKQIDNWEVFDKYVRKVFPANSSFGEGCSFGKGCKAKSPYWSFVYEPPFQTIGKILPTEAARKNWDPIKRMLSIYRRNCCTTS
jgi:hypothetical protein